MSNSKLLRIFNILLPFFYAGLILYVSTLPDVDPPSFNIDNIDKLYHGLEYFVFSVVILRALPKVHESRRRWWLYLLLILAGSAFAAMDEFLQSFVPNRDSTPGDWVADTIGFAVAAISVALIRTRFGRNFLTN